MEQKMETITIKDELHNLDVIIKALNCCPTSSNKFDVEATIKHNEIMDKISKEIKKILLKIK